MLKNEDLSEIKQEELNKVSGGTSIPGLEAIGPCALGDGNLTPEEIQKLREIGDSLKPSTQNVR